MSLNKLTTSSDYLKKQYLNIGCNKIECSAVEVEGANVLGTSFNDYTPTIEANVNLTQQGSKCIYSVIGNKDKLLLDIKGVFSIIAVNSLTIYNIVFNLPDNLITYDNENILTLGNISSLSPPKAAYSCVLGSQVANSNSITIVLISDSTSTLSIGPTQIVNFNVVLYAKYLN